MPTFSPFVLLAILCGAFVPIHASMNAGLSRSIGHPLWATIMSFGVSAVCLITLLVVLRPEAPTWPMVRATPLWAWLGGGVAIAYVMAGMVLVPRLGAANFIASVIAGQMIVAVALDHFGVLGFPHRPVDLSRMVGAMLIIGGVFTVQLSAQPRPPL